MCQSKCVVLQQSFYSQDNHIYICLNPLYHAVSLCTVYFIIYEINLCKYMPNHPLQMYALSSSYPENPKV